MIHVHAGTDTFGRVKAVAGTAIVTKFAMFQFLPVFPLKSYYFIGKGPTTKYGIPFFASTHEASIVGLPLASLDVASVVMAYLRAVAGAMVIIGFMVMVPGMMYLTGEPIDDLGMMMIKGLLGSLGIGSVIGWLSYAIPLTSHRDRDIRAFLRGDPGRLGRSGAVALEARSSIEEAIHDLGLMGDDARTRKIRQLIATRWELAASENAPALEDRTDDLLEQLRAEDRIAA